MKKLDCFIAAIVLLMLFTSCQENSIIEESPQHAQLKASDKLTGFDDWGFNFNAQIFDGYLINAMFGDPVFAGTPHYRQMIYMGEGPEFWEQVIANYSYFKDMMPADLLDCKLKMKWNSDLLPKNGIYPETWVDSDAWIVFHYSMNTDEQEWTQMRKLVARKTEFNLIGDKWYSKDGTEVGKQSYYWPDLMIIQVMNNGDNPFVPMAMPEDYISPYGAGYGKHKVK